MYETRYPSPGGHVKVGYKRAPNFLERLGSSMVGSVIGLILVAGACALLFWNEGRSVYTYDVISEAQRGCQSVGDPSFSSDHLINQLIYLTGTLNTVEVITDVQYGISVHAAKLRRKVEMYQWVEESRTVEHKEHDGSIRTETRYSYSEMWRDNLVSSSAFDDVRHENPREMPVMATEVIAERVSVGVYILGSEAVGMLENWQRVVLSTPLNSGLQLHNNMLYHGNLAYPRVGDVRVSFEYAGSTRPGHEDKVSVVARQGPGHVLSPYHSQVHVGYTILYLHMGSLGMEELFESEYSSNSTLTWVLRLVGLLLMCVGFNMVTRILVTLVDWLPLVRELVALSTFLLSLVLALSLSLVVMAVAWIRYRPLYGLALLTGAALPFVLSKLVSDKNKRRQ